MNQWDQRYDKDEYHYGTAPNDFLREQAKQFCAPICMSKFVRP